MRAASASPVDLRRVAATLSLLASFALSCATTTEQDFARMDARGRDLLDRQQWTLALAVSRKALEKCDRTEWCKKDPRYQGLFHTNLGKAEENLGRRDRALEHYRKAFYAYPLFFTENYFRMLRDAGMYRLLRQEIDVKLASNEAASRSASSFWLSNEPSVCGGRSVGGSYRWSLRSAGGSARMSGKAVVSQSGCMVTADIPLPPESGAGGLLHFRGDVHSGVANVLFGPPCVSTDRGQLMLTKDGFTINADRAAAAEGCLRGPYTLEFVRE
jgi:tetratricopeptide (TPR) repeat protein